MCQIVFYLPIPSHLKVMIYIVFQRHFTTFAVSFPGTDALFTIYSSILSDHLDSPTNKFPFLVRKMCGNIVNATLSLHLKVSQVN